MSEIKQHHWLPDEWDITVWEDENIECSGEYCSYCLLSRDYSKSEEEQNPCLGFIHD